MQQGEQPVPCGSGRWCHAGLTEGAGLAFLLPQPGTTGLGHSFRGLSSLGSVPVGSAREEQSGLLQTWLYSVACIFFFFPLGSLGMCWELGGREEGIEMAVTGSPWL